MDIYLTNTTIIPNDGTYSCETISLETIKTVIAEGVTFASAIGHQSTADILTELLGIPINVNRIAITREVDDIMIAFKLKQRPPEGKILTQEEIEEIGYEFKMIERVY